jgi:hypothetical protein
MSKLTTKWITDDAVTKEKINADVAGDGLSQAAGGELDVNVDDVTLETNADTVRVKDLGIGTAKLAGTSVTAAKLGADVAGDGLTGGNGSDLDVEADSTGGSNLGTVINVSANGVAVKIDDDTIVENGSNQLAVGANSIGTNEIDESDNFTWTGTHDFQSGTIHVPTPSSDTHAVTKAYADSLRAGIRSKDLCRALADTNQALSGVPTTIDGVTGWSAGDRILLTGQTSADENGIWEVQAGSWTRPSDFDTGDSASGAQTWIDQGSTYGESQWTCTTDEPNDVIDTNNLAFVQTSGAGQVTAGTGLTKSGNTVHVGDGSTGNIGGINRTADDIAAAVDDSTIEVASNVLQVKDLGISTAKLAATSVTPAKLGAVAGNGLTGGSGSDLDVDPDTTGGANLGKVINVSANGVAVKIDDSTIGENGSNQLEVKDAGITETQLNASVAGEGLTGGAGSALDLDINGLVEDTTPDASDFLVFYDTSEGAHNKVKRSDLIAGASGETMKQYMHLVTGGEDTAGYFVLPSSPSTVQSVRVTPKGGILQTNKQAVGSSGAAPDFDVLNTNQVHINNNGAATGLSGDIASGDTLIVKYSE